LWLVTDDAPFNLGSILAFMCFDLVSYFFLKLSKIDISENLRFLPRIFSRVLIGPANRGQTVEWPKWRRSALCSWLVQSPEKITTASTPRRTPSNGFETANQKETSQPESRAVEFVFTLFSQAFEDRHFRNLRDFLAPAFEGGELSLGGWRLRWCSVKTKARTSQGQLPELTRWQAPRRETRSAVAVQDHYQAAAEEMQDDRRRSEHVGLFCHVRWQTATGPRRFSSVLALLHPAACRFEDSSFLSRAFERRHFRKLRKSSNRG